MVCVCYNYVGIVHDSQVGFGVFGKVVGCHTQDHLSYCWHIDQPENIKMKANFMIINRINNYNLSTIEQYYIKSNIVRKCTKITKLFMLTLNLLSKVNSKTEWLAVLNDDIVEGKRVLCIDEVLDMVL